uniref:Transmembrane protein 98 n=1 Tax=Panagrolaimus sp. JU765 TaxID=591449 RepID=A0AC34PXK0_9BILA
MQKLEPTRIPVYASLPSKSEPMMDVVVILAITVLAFVFILSLIILIIMCKRRCDNARGFPGYSLRFSKLRQDNVDDVIQLSPHISQALDNNQWIYDVSGILEHCVAVLKLCHTLTDKLAKIPLNSISPQLNEVICQATARVVPRFDDLLKSMAAPNVDVRLIEARMVALVTTCWSLVSPFYLMNPKYKEVFGSIIREMEGHQRFLQLAVEHATENAKLAESSAHGTPTRTAAEIKLINEKKAAAIAAALDEPPETPPERRNGAIPSNAGTAAGQNRVPLAVMPPPEPISIRIPDESRQELLSSNDEAPADPILPFSPLLHTHLSLDDRQRYSMVSIKPLDFSVYLFSGKFFAAIKNHRPRFLPFFFRTPQV